MSAEIISIAMNKGGVGKTSLINNLTGALTKKLKKKVLLVDMDGQGNLGISFGLVPENLDTTIHDVLINDVPIKDAILKVHRRVHILPANIKMSLVEFDILPNLDNFTEPFNLLKNALEPVLDDYDYIFIDTPPSMGIVVGNALVAADKVIIPYVPEIFAVYGLIVIHKAIMDFKEQHNPKLQIAGVLAMMTDLRTTLHQDMLQQARVHCYENDINMFDTVIPKSIRFASSSLKGKPATWSFSKNHLVSSYYDFLEELLEKELINNV